MADKHQYACATCGHEQDSMGVPCEKCGSYRVFWIEALVKVTGQSWDELKKGPFPMTKL